MALEPIEPQPGSDRDPANFVGRTAITSQARKRLQVGANLLLTDPRRMGKTFWMHTFAAREKRFHCYFIDYEGVFTVNDFLIRTADALIKGGKLPSRAFQKLKTIFDNCDIEISSPITIKSYHRQTSPHVLLTDILSTLDGEENDVIPLVMMDEVPMAVNNIAEREGAGAAEEILQTLRALRQKTTRVRWIVTGSVGFHHVLRKTKMTQGVLLGVGQELRDEVVSELVTVSGGIPFLLHKLVGTLAQGHYTAFTPSDVRDCFEDFIDDPDEFRWFEHYLTRVTPHYGERAQVADQILRQTISQTNEWIPVDSLTQGEEFSEVLEDLVKDHYLERRGRSVRWRYPALQYIWARKKGVWDRQ